MKDEKRIMIVSGLAMLATIIAGLVHYLVVGF